MGMSQMCTGADHYFRSSKPHSGKLCVLYSTVYCGLEQLPLSPSFTPPVASWLVKVIIGFTLITGKLLRFPHFEPIFVHFIRSSMKQKHC